MTYRDTKSLNNLQFRTEIKEGYENIPICNMQDKVCHTLISKAINTHAPLKTKQIKVVLDAPWFDFEYKALRRRRRKAERRYRKTGLVEHKNEFVELRNQTTALAIDKKKTYYVRKIDECNRNCKLLFACVNQLLDTKQNTILPSHNSTEELADRRILKKKLKTFEKHFLTPPMKQIQQSPYLQKMRYIQ